MRNADTVRAIHQERGAQGLPLERVYKQLFNPEIYLEGYGKLYRNQGAMTKGSTDETVDGMNLQKIHNIIALIRQERYEWAPVRRTDIPKANGKTRPLGIPTWSDKLVQEALRSLLEPYYEQQFSDRSYGFRPNRGCQMALNEIRKHWRGTTWFIEGDIKGCFDNIDHTILSEIIRRNIHDGRIVKLIEDLLKAGYMKDLNRYETTSGTPQGGIVSPLLANIYLHELDKFLEDTLLPEYTRGDRRGLNPEYQRVSVELAKARRHKDLKEIIRLRSFLRTLPSSDCYDPTYRRLRFVRYADDFLLGFVGPKKEAEVIRDRIRDFLRDHLRLTLSEEKTLVTHATNDKANFLGYEITASRVNTRISDGRRQTNGTIALLMPRQVLSRTRADYSKGNSITHRAELLAENDYTIVQRYQSVMMGIYNYYCMATNVSRRMADIKWVLETSLTKTLAHKHKCTVTQVYQKFQARDIHPVGLRVIIDRPGRKPLIATFGGVPLVRKPDGMGNPALRYDVRNWFNQRSENIDRLLAEKCELCGEARPLVAHHVRKLADLDRPGRKPKALWEKIMSARKRKTLMVCKECHWAIHAGQHDGPRLGSSPRASAHFYDGLANLAALRPWA
jgi:group II intron reverse transcriptase/maturase